MTNLYLEMYYIGNKYLYYKYADLFKSIKNGKNVNKPHAMHVLS